MREIALIGLTLVTFFVVLLLLKRDKQVKDYLLTTIFFCIGSELLFRFLLYSNVEFYHSNLILLDIIYWALFGPVLLFYTKSVIDKSFRFTIQDLTHLLPLLISIIGVSFYIFNKPSYNSFPHFFNTSEGLIRISMLIWEFASPLYLPFILYMLILHRKRVKDIYSNTERKELNWLFLIVTGFTMFIYISDLLWFFTDIFPVSESLKVLTIVLTVFVFVLGVYGYKQDSLFSDRVLSSKPMGKLVHSKVYQKNLVDQNERKSISNALKELMLSDKPYLESEITINELAEKIGVSAYKLSRVINEDFNQNFFDFINTYRIDEVKRQLMETKENDLKIESIAYDCGFNSKSTFYSLFKKHTSMTPTHYRNKYTQQVGV